MAETDTYLLQLKKQVYAAPEGGFAVFRAVVQENGAEVTLVGPLTGVTEGDRLQVEGERVSHPRFGEQIKVHSYTLQIPGDQRGLINFLSSGRFHGIGKKTAERIVSTFGDSTLEVIENDPSRLQSIRGIGSAITREVTRKIRENRVLRDMIIMLTPHRIGQETILKILEIFGPQAIEIIRRNPYMLIGQVRGIGFKTADALARQEGIPPTASERIKAGIDLVFSQAEQRFGDMVIEEDQAVQRSASLLRIDDQEIVREIETKIQRSELVRKFIPEPILTTHKNYIVEDSSARLLRELRDAAPQTDTATIDFSIINQRLDLELTEEQENAIRTAVRQPITILTGGPGTGKTTIIRGLIEALAASQQRVQIAAPTGRAAKRIEETSHYPASTIHRLLKIRPETREFYHDESNPLPADAIIVDEFSMVDSFLFYALLRACRRGCRLIMIGDKDQLPSVGPGNVLRDLIHSQFFTTIYLNRNFRQTESRLIVENAHRVNTGQSLDTRPYSDDLDFVYLRVHDARQAREKLEGILTYHRNRWDFNSFDLQILIPMYKGPAGIDQVNTSVQQRFNSRPPCLERLNRSFKIGDKVIQLRNNYDKEVFNGEQGVIVDFDQAEGILTVDFSGYPVEYRQDELDDLTLAYAISIHKAQGSEYEAVIMVLLGSHSGMLNREIVYTGISRARKKLFLLSDDATMQAAIENPSPRRRKTLLPQQLQGHFEPTPPGNLPPQDGFTPFP